MYKYERKEKENFEPKCTSLVLYVNPIEDEEEDEPLMRCFAKEYPDMSIKEMREKIEKLDDKYRELEHKYSTLDAGGTENTYEFCMPDAYIFTMEELSNIFDEIIEIFEEG